MCCTEQMIKIALTVNLTTKYAKNKDENNSD